MFWVRKLFERPERYTQCGVVTKAERTENVVCLQENSTWQSVVSCYIVKKIIWEMQHGSINWFIHKMQSEHAHWLSQSNLFKNKKKLHNKMIGTNQIKSEISDMEQILRKLFECKTWKDKAEQSVLVL